ncbi:Uncharacterised protein [Bordetella ansorpii]|uniref:HPt domain-containing protein n=2 Tax=Bordetella ansorpii TaxID=288768 RepID=A0A157SN24_9BORD|nr:Uncharacterised protein [Bordetella ansorpii]
MSVPFPPDGRVGPPGHALPSLAMLDLPRLRGICPDASQLNRLLLLAREQLHADLTRMRAALERGDAVAAAERIHHIKGAACMLCPTGDGLLGQLDAARAATLACTTMRDIGPVLADLEKSLRSFDAQLQAAIRAKPEP